MRGTKRIVAGRVTQGGSRMTSRIVHRLDYASPGAERGVSSLLRDGLGFSAAIGLLFNFGFIYLYIYSTYPARWAYQDLMQNPKAYGREIAPAIIASLRDPYGLWLSTGAAIVGLAFGMLLALHLLVAVVQMDRRPEASLRRMRQYERWKPIGALITVAALCWAGTESTDFWTRATRHHALGSDELTGIWAVLIAACALEPWWLVRKALRAEVREQLKAAVLARMSPEQREKLKDRSPNSHDLYALIIAEARRAGYREDGTKPDPSDSPPNTS